MRVTDPPDSYEISPETARAHRWFLIGLYVGRLVYPSRPKRPKHTPKYTRRKSNPIPVILQFPGR